MHQGDHSSFYSQNAHVNPPDHHISSYASAPPFTGGYVPADYSSRSQNFRSYPMNPDPAPPTAPAYTPTSPNPNLLQPQQPPLSSFNPSSQPPVLSFPPYDSHGTYQPQTTQQSYYPPHDLHQTVSNYAPPSTSVSPYPSPIPSPIPPYSSMYSAPYSSVGSSTPSVYDNSYVNPVKFDGGGGYIDDKYGGFGRSQSDLGSGLYGKRPEIGGYSRYDLGCDDGPGDGVYAYNGGKTEPYGARGTDSKSSTWSMFDDYGRPISVPSVKENSSTSGSSKIVKAVPKADTQQDVKSGVQKFRVKLLAESVGQTIMDVLCQIGLDGIRMLDPATNRTLRIYSLETITRCEVMDSSTLAFWSKSSVDIEPRRIRLQSNSHTTSTLLDIITAATVQVKEMGGGSRAPDSSNTTEQPIEKKKGFVDWMNLIKPPNEEKDHWVPDEAASKCIACGTHFGAFVRRHHCRNCGDIFCDKCTNGRVALTAEENAQPVRVCDRCMAEVTQRLSNAKDAANRPAVQSHEDLARKLQEEMEKNRKASSGPKSDGAGRRMREVACPICTVHLQVQVPSSGSETIECGVCQHPFLVSAH